MYAAAPAPMPDLAALTDAEGAFTLEPAAMGRYELAIVADGFARAEVATDVDDTGDAEVNVVLEVLD